MPSSMTRVLAPFVALLLAAPAFAAAQEEEDFPTPSAEEAQAYNDAQSCAIILRKLGGEANEAKAEVQLERAKALAPAVGHDSEETFQQSYDQMAEILDMASEEEMEQFIKACQAAE
ncbi:hypothetical protein CVO77_01535 [Sphingopyxis lindanitolerans]|uniref:DUF4168 domain-containing protein n=2 Tax=Sphingopyxis lindanitolerans TaxID=2054227 RepID=A0A2S8BBB1_9SPHN|nr:hypothetical protein CVO77_01535 [Sphingopyxis lindanitolerans]